MFNKTKIIATIGPASSSEEMLKEMIKAGVDVCRLNFSHSDYEHHQQVIETVRRINQQNGTHIAILADLQGPKLRIGEIVNGATVLEPGSFVILTTIETEGTSERLFVNYDQFASDVKEGDKILIDDGRIQLIVIETNKKDEVRAVVQNGGIVSSRKGVNLPQTKISLPSLTKKDHEDLQFALKMNVDWIGLSFVRSASDILELKKIITSTAEARSKDTRYAWGPKVVAKIEKPEALNDIESIIAATDALMVARGDLGVELPMEEVPLIQKKLVEQCLRASKPVIIATQMMESMIVNSTPTRAEISDVANSVLDGADAVMLSGETSVGKYPALAVGYMRNVITSVEEKGYRFNRNYLPSRESDTFLPDSVCHNACVMASQVQAKAIVGITRSGYTAFKVSAQRPEAGIFIFSDVVILLNQLSLVWGVRAFYYLSSASTNESISELQEVLKRKEFVTENDLIINLASMPLQEQGRTNMIKLSRVK